MLLLFYVNYCPMFSPFKDKFDEDYASFQTDFNIEDDGELNKYLGISLDRRPDCSIYLSQPYVTKIILNIIPGMDKSRSKTTTTIKPSSAKNEGYQARKNDFNYKSVIGLLNFPTDSNRPKAQFTVHQCTLFRTDPKLPHDQAVKSVLHYQKNHTKARINNEAQY